jgi:hypothetical protein
LGGRDRRGKLSYDRRLEEIRGLINERFPSLMREEVQELKMGDGGRR